MCTLLYFAVMILDSEPGKEPEAATSLRGEREMERVREEKDEKRMSVLEDKRGEGEMI